MANTTNTRLDDLPADFVSFNQGPIAERVAAAMMGISFGFVLLRLVSRATRKARLGLDDWIILAALVLTTKQIPSMAYLSTTFILDIHQRDNIWRFDNSSQALHTGHVRPALSNQVHEKGRRQPRNSSNALVSCSDTGEYYYGYDVPTFDPAAVVANICSQYANNILFTIVPHIVIDIIILSLPIREVRRLQIVNWQKAAVCGMFLLGGSSPSSVSYASNSLPKWSTRNPDPIRRPLIRMVSAYIVRKTQQSSSSHASAAAGRSNFPPAGSSYSDNRGSRGWTGDSSRPLNHADSEASFKFVVQDIDLELGHLSKEQQELQELTRQHPAFRNTFPMGLNILPTARRSAGPLTLSPIRAERPISLGLQGILKKSYI
ncbi:uncharacterized protein PG998_002102 [Apiospora kogelbergensis]|uniref:uncharacterized protein n=1 Tax=Apiospora kogelbergensis TaxID=1337665 RepID=UPI0031327097